MKRIRINAELIKDWDSFHDQFSDMFGFPEFYGKNMDAWIDCMSYLDDCVSGMTKVWINKGETLIIELYNNEVFKNRSKEIYLKLLQCIAIVNKRNLEANKKTTISLVLA
jgi:RNAse (barnase) inhibitor barstar